MRSFIIFALLIFSQIFYSQSCSSITATDIFGNPSAQVSCGVGACVELTTTTIPATYLTTSYQLDQQTFAPVIPFNAGTPLKTISDDIFSDIIPMPFNFCFYGATYNKLIISTNGFITFDTKQAALVSNPNIIATNPSDLLPKNSIFGVMQDLIFSEGADSEIYYSVVGTAPCRKFVINFYKARITGCTETSTSQIVLSEFTNEIEINVENKPLPCSTAKFKEALIGTLNADGTDGLSPAGRNRDIWQSGTESWKYSPSGAAVQPSITWKNSANEIVGNTATINACPKKTDIYTVTLDYLVCGTSFTISDDINISYGSGGSIPDVQTPVDYSETLCDNNADDSESFDWASKVAPLITKDSTMIVRFYSTMALAELGGSGLTTIKGGKYQVFARVTNQSGCYAIATVNMDISFLEKIQARDIKKLYCFDGKENFEVNLDTLYPEMLITPLSKITRVTYYPTLEDATEPNDLELLQPIQQLTKNGNVVVYTFFVRFENAAGCFTVKRITIELRNPVTDPNQNICDFGNDGVENVLLSSLNGAVIAGQPVTVRYFSDNASANANTGPITNFLLQTGNPANIIYVRLDMKADNGDCYRVYPVSLTLISSPVLTREFVPADLGLICDNNNDGSEPVDLTQYQKEIYTGAENFTYAFYETYNPVTGVFGSKIANPKAYQIRSNTDVYARVSKGACFTAAKITITFNFLPAVLLKPGVIAQCDKGYDYGETYNLDDAVASMFLAQNQDPLSQTEVKFYNTREDANQGLQNNISNSQTTFYNTVTFWARFQSKNTGCFSVVPLVLKTYFPPKAIPSSIQVCDRNLDGNPEVNLLAPEYTKFMVSETDPENNFRFYLTLDDVHNNRPISNPENFSAKPFPGRIYVLVENIAGCFTLPATIDFTLGAGLPVGMDTFNIEKCDAFNDGKEMLDLSQFQGQITTGASFEYYPTLQDLNNDTKKITTPGAYAYDSSQHPPVIYLKVSKNAFCPALIKINITFKKAPVFDLESYYFCPGVGIRIEPDLSALEVTEFTWKNPAGEIISKEKYITNVKTEGKYSLTIRSKNGCTHTDYFDVLAFEVPVITKLVSLSSTAYQVIATGSRKIVYSKDGIRWQDSNIFENLEPGIVTFYVRFEDSKCLGDTKQGLSVKVVNVITPNDDGKNDLWTFQNLNIFGDAPSNIKIYDVNGVMVYEQTSTDSFIWNGQYNGRNLPTSSYWYIMVLPDKTVTGWILLKNRN